METMNGGDDGEDDANWDWHQNKQNKPKPNLLNRLGSFPNRTHRETKRFSNK